MDAVLSATLARFTDYKGEAGHRHVVLNATFPKRRTDRYRTGVGASAQDKRSQRRTDQVRLGLSATVSEATIGAFGVLRKYCPGWTWKG